MMYVDAGQSLRLGKKAQIDPVTRDRLRAWLRYFLDRSGETQEAFARSMGTKQAAISQILNGKRDMGLELLLRMSSRCRRSLDELVDTWPPTAAKAPPPNPTEASPAAVTPGRRRKTGRE